ncbi:hypothetical protein H4R22_004919 [Coemansia sp. RSA 1290]|nr:O-methyltransferase [Coemansia mojavensis]KAJ1738194.1 hypothetical protein LPJ68_005752 [Coemansia sp. RSA 1086]KAJ1747028.1 hypothetical protein LPJ79_005536 [Coemansia sp. RSA 1821]KAJ2626170.1 hypothetical protein H4R22_004919 [Coemansia sp. RSA 1290]
MAFTETFGSEEDYKDASPEELRLYYASKASVIPHHNTPTVPPAISKIYKQNAAQYGWLSVMAVSEYQGMLQNFVIGLIGAKKILEIGLFTGASAIFFATGLARNGVAGQPDSNGYRPVISLEVSEEYATVARKNFADANVEDYIDVMVGDAHESLAKLTDQKFDLIFIDADKESYLDYYKTIMDNEMLSKKGLIIADNTAFDCVTRLINTPVPVENNAPMLDMPESNHSEWKETGKALHEFNEYIRQDPCVEVVMLPLFTGITFIRLLSS